MKIHRLLPFIARRSLPYLLVIFSMNAYAQNGLLRERSVLDYRMGEFKRWLASNDLHLMLEVVSYEASPQRLVVDLSPIVSCKAGGKEWKKYSDEFHKFHSYRVEERLLERLAFITEIAKDSVELTINSRIRDPNETSPCSKIKVRIHWEKGRLVVEEDIENDLGGGKIYIPIDKISNVYTGDNVKISGKTLANLREKIGLVLRSYYSDKGTPLLYRRELEVVEESWNFLTYEVTKISNEILKNNYFEFIRIEILLFQYDNFVTIHYNLQARYGSGIAVPPPRSDYKDMETDFPAEVRNYAQKLEDGIRRVLTE